MKILNNKLLVMGILIFLSILIVALSIYLVYEVNAKEECFCDSFEAPLISADEEAYDNQKVIYVEVKGAVNSPGVYEMHDTNIINDAIIMAGGFKEDAYTDNINLSKRVEDELVIYVFSESEYKKNNKSSGSSSNINTTNDSYYIDTKDNVSIITSDGNSVDTDDSSEASNALININLATVAELTELPGIGESKAAKIVTYRNEFGFFKTIEDLKNVSGIGDATFEQLKNYITV